MKRKTGAWWLVGRWFGALGLAGVLAAGVTAGAADKAADVMTIKGTCTFGKKTSDWSATLTPKGNGIYDAVYVSSWSGQPLNYVGTLKTDSKTKISGKGKPSGGRANGTFEFSGTYGAGGIAQCHYEEVGGRGRKGTMTAGIPGKAAPDPSPAR